MIVLMHWFKMEWQWLALAVCVLMCVLSLRQFWLVFHQHIHIVLSCITLLMFNLVGLTMESGHLAGMSFHLLGFNLASLISNRQTALLLGMMTTSMLVLAQAPDHWTTLPLTWALTLLPAYAICTLGEWATRRFLPTQLFIYIFIRGFVVAGLSMLCTGVVLVLSIHQTGAFSGSFLASTLPVFFLLTWSEAFLTGIVVALMIAFKSNLLLSFDEERYLKSVKTIWK